MISIIIPTFNEEKLIKSTIEKLTAGLILPHEIIVSDDGSTDKTVEILRAMEQVQVVVNSHARGEPRTIARNRNNGAKYATGDFLVFIDASCHIDNPRLFFEQAIENFNTKNILAVTGWVLIDPQLATLADTIVLGIINRGYLVSNNFLHTGTATGKFQMFRRDVFLNIGGYNEKLVTCEDIDIFKRISKIGRTYFDTRLKIYHPGRREHTFGWIRLLSIWTVNNIWFILFNRALAKEWSPIR